MATFPYFYRGHIQLSGSGTGTIQFEVPEGESLEVHGIRQASDGTFDITGIRDSRGRVYSNAASGGTLPGQFIADADNQFNGFTELATPLILQGNNTLSFDLVDTSTATNDVWITLMAIRNDGS